MKRMTVIAALTTALLAGITPCNAQESLDAAATQVQSANTVVTAETSTNTSATVTVTETATASATAVADAVADAMSTTTTSATSATTGNQDAADQDFWHDTEAQRGDTIRVAFDGDHTFDDLRVEVSSPFQSFRATVLPDQTIIVSVPQNFTAAAKVSPVFTVLDGDEPVDTFTVSVEYSRPKVDVVENSTPLFRLISDIAFRLPQLPFMAFLFDD